MTESIKGLELIHLLNDLKSSEGKEALELQKLDRKRAARPKFEAINNHYGGTQMEFDIINKGQRGFFKNIESINEAYSFSCYSLDKWIEDKIACRVYGFTKGVPVGYSSGGLKILYKDDIGTEYSQIFTIANGRIQANDPIEID